MVCQGGKQKSLSLYLESFALTTKIMQNSAALERVAFEAVEDLASEHVCYAEIRFAPILHIEGGLSLEEAVQAVLDGLQRGTRKTGMPTGLILCAMRNQSPSVSKSIAELAVAFADRGVVGFDLAGDEIGYPPRNILMHSSSSEARTSILPSMQERPLGWSPSGRLYNCVELTVSGMEFAWWKIWGLKDQGSRKWVLLQPSSLTGEFRWKCVLPAM